MKILAFLTRKLLQLALLLLLVTLATFILSALIPGDFFTQHQTDPAFQTEALSRLRERYGLNLPFYSQYARWLGNLAKLDLGVSLFYRTPVSTIVFGALGRTLWLGIPALLLGLGAGVCLGTLRAVQRERPFGRLLDFLSTTALSLPSIVLGLGALFLAVRTRWFPLGGMNSVVIPQPGFLPWLTDRLHHLLLPVACLTVPILASVERIQHAAARSALENLYIRAARSRGLSPLRIFGTYLLRPALNPILATSGPMIGAVLSGSLVLEVIFSWPGLGQVTYDALFNRDIYLLAGCVIASGLLLVAGGFAADLLLYALDPRTRESFRGAR